MWANIFNRRRNLPTGASARRNTGVVFRAGRGLCVPKTSNPTIAVMKSAQDGA